MSARRRDAPKAHARPTRVFPSRTWKLSVMAETPVHLGQKSILSPEQIADPRSILDTFPNPRPGRDYDIRFVFPEFTSMCPVTGQPDFATITLSYTPADRCVEMKSLKLYFLAFRNKGIFYEGVANTILDDLVAKLAPTRMTVTADFNARGGTVGVITCRHGAS
jgi:7-cyano-7-deazaguanine reductase